MERLMCFNSIGRDTPTDRENVRRLVSAARSRRLVSLLRERRFRIVKAWADEAQEHPLLRGDLAPNGRLDRMWRLTAALDLAIVRAGGQV